MPLYSWLAPLSQFVYCGDSKLSEEEKMIGIEVVDVGSEEKPDIRAMVMRNAPKRNSATKRRVVHQNGGQKLLEGLVELDEGSLVLCDLARAALLLGMSFERSNPGKYPILDSE